MFAHLNKDFFSGSPELPKPSQCANTRRVFPLGLRMDVNAYHMIQ